MGLELKPTDVASVLLRFLIIALATLADEMSTSVFGKVSSQFVAKRALIKSRSFKLSWSVSSLFG